MLRKTSNREEDWGDLNDIITVSVSIDVVYDENTAPKGWIKILVIHTKSGKGTVTWTADFSTFPVTRTTSALTSFLKQMERNLKKRNKPEELKGILAYIARNVVGV